MLPGRTVELECDALYKFTTKTSFSWIFNGSDLIVSNAVSQDTFSYNLSQNNGDLRIENISGTAYGVYQCVAKYSGLAIISRPARVRKPCEYIISFFVYVFVCLIVVHFHWAAPSVLDCSS